VNKGSVASLLKITLNGNGLGGLLGGHLSGKESETTGKNGKYFCANKELIIFTLCPPFTPCPISLCRCAVYEALALTQLVAPGGMWSLPSLPLMCTLVTDACALCQPCWQ
jgi:hypothetical protein